MGHDMIAANLVRLRKDRGFSQAELASRSDLALSSYRSIELRKSMPRVDTLQAIAQALGVRLQDLLKETPRLEHVRFRAHKRLNRRESILVETARWLHDFAELEDLVGKGRPDIRWLRDAAAGISKRSLNKAVEVAHVARSRLLGPEHGDDDPIHDICGLLEAHGIKVRTTEVISDAFFGLSVAPEESGGPAIVVNSWERIPVERWIFTAAHELGHLVLHHHAYDSADVKEDPQQEAEADAFAGEFLMPSAAFQKEWNKNGGLPLVDRVLKVKRIFRVSYKTVLYRLSRSSRHGKTIWQRFQAEHARRIGRTLLKADEPLALPPDEFHAWARVPEGSRAAEPDWLSRSDFLEGGLAGLVRNAIEDEKITLSRGGEILGLSLQQMRELARSWVA